MIDPTHAGSGVLHTPWGDGACAGELHFIFTHISVEAPSKEFVFAVKVVAENGQDSYTGEGAHTSHGMHGSACSRFMRIAGPAGEAHACACLMCQTFPGLCAW